MIIHDVFNMACMNNDCLHDGLSIESQR